MVLLSDYSEAESIIGKVNELLDQFLEQSIEQGDVGETEAEQATETTVEGLQRMRL